MNLSNNIRKIYKLSAVVLAVSVLVRIYFSNTLVADNKKLNQLFVQRDELKKEISRLTYVENNLSALDILEQRAYSLGYVKMTNTMLSLEITSHNSIAYNATN